MKKILLLLILILLLALPRISAQSVSGAYISGTFRTGFSVTGYFTSVPDTLSSPVIEINWYRVTVSDSTLLTEHSSAYNIVAADIGKKLMLQVILRNSFSTFADTAYSPLSPLITANSVPVASSVTVTVLSDLNVGSTLLGSYTYTDADNDPEGTSTYQWSRSDNPTSGYSNITGANIRAYVIQLADTGSYLKFSVRPGASSGETPGTMVTSATGEGPVNNAPYISNLSIPGTVTYPGTIEADYNFHDPDNDANASEYVWYRNNVVIPGANSKIYTLVSADQGTGIKVRVTPKSASGIPNVGTAETSGTCNVGISTKPLAEDVCIRGERKVGSNVLIGQYTYNENGTSGQSGTVVEWLVDDIVVKTGLASVTADRKLSLNTANVDKKIQYRVTPKTSTISGDPVISAPFTIISNSKTSFSINEDAVEMTADPAVGSIPGAKWEFTGDGIDESGGLYYFDPGDASLDLADSPFTIKEIYETPEGCVQNAYIDFDVDSSNVFFNPVQFRDFFCYEDVDVTIDVTGLPSPFSGTGTGYLSGSGSFSLSAPIAGGIISQTDTQVRINPQAIGPGNEAVSLIYIYTQMTAIEILPGLYQYIPVVYAISRPFVIDFIDPALSITNLPAEYCEEGAPFDIFADNMIPGGGTGSWSSPILSGQNNLIATLNPSLITGGGAASVGFTYTSPIGCKRTVTSNIYINPSPSADFDIVDGCIEGANDTIKFENLTSSTDPVISWFWTFGDINNNISNAFAPGHLYRSPGIKNVELIAYTSKGCRDTARIPIELGIKPVADFYWEDDCFKEGDNLNLFDATVALSPIDSTTWLFNGVDAFRSSGISDATYLKTGAPGVVNIDYFVYTDYPECSDTVSKAIFIRPTVTLSDGDYFEDFEGAQLVWLPDNSPGNSWVLGTPDRSKINSAASGVNAYYTGFDPLAQSRLNYAVESPCFDFTGMSRPMVKLKIWKGFDKNRDGAALQYKIGNDPLWEHIGTLDDGIEWYNSVTINGRPGGTQIGWTSLKENLSYVEARQKLDFLNNETDVKFRIVYGSDGTSITNDGLAFDDFWIGERTRTVLVEHFANNSEAIKSITATSIVNEIVGNSSKDVVNIRYHTNFPGEDLLYYDNPADPSARKLFYGLTQIPYTLYGGGGLTEGMFDKRYEYYIKEPDSLDLKKRSMIDPLFHIEVNAAISGGIVTVTGEIDALKDIAETNMTLYVAVVARDITTVSANNNDTNIRNVLRKMLPSAGGTDIKTVWNSGESLPFGDFSWNISDIYDATELEVIVFLQNNHTKQVFQAASSGVLGGFTAIGDFTSENNRFAIYPNPASQHLDIAFNKGLPDKSRVVIFNHTGMAVKTVEVARATEQISLDDLNLPDGLYIVRLYEGSIPTAYRKLIITNR